MQVEFSERGYQPRPPGSTTDKVWLAQEYTKVDWGGGGARGIAVGIIIF